MISASKCRPWNSAGRVRRMQDKAYQTAFAALQHIRPDSWHTAPLRRSGPRLSAGHPVAKFKALQGFICYDCRSTLAAAGHTGLADALEPILDRKWIRRKSIPGSPASVMSKLGYDLFLTKGLQPTFWETAKGALRKDGVKEILKIASTLLIAALL